MGKITIIIPADVVARIDDLPAHKAKMIEAATIAVAHRSVARADVLGIREAIQARLAHDARRRLHLQPKYPPGSRKWKQINSMVDYEAVRRQIEVVVEQELGKD